MSSYAAAVASAAFETEGLVPQTWSNGPDAVYAEHAHPYDKVLFCIEGSITFHLRADDLPMGPADRIDLPAGTPHAATVGPEGVTCMEAART